jgi:hypothetical protein
VYDSNTSLISRNKTQEMAVEAYCQMFSSELCTPFIFNSNFHVMLASASAGWLLQMSKIFQDPIGKRVTFCNSFYTHHNLVSVLKKNTDFEVQLVGTCRFTNIDASNYYYLKVAIE